MNTYDGICCFVNKRTHVRCNKRARSQNVPFCDLHFKYRNDLNILTINKLKQPIPTQPIVISNDLSYSKYSENNPMDNVIWIDIKKAYKATY
jgi:hypothetical protein